MSRHFDWRDCSIIQLLSEKFRNSPQKNLNYMVALPHVSGGANALELSKISIFLNSIAALIRQRDLTRLAEQYRYPLPFYHSQDVVLFHDQQEFIAAHVLRSTFLCNSGVDRVEPEIIEVEDFTDKRCMVVVQWHHILEDGTTEFSSKVRYVCRAEGRDGAFKIELIEYLVPVFTEFPEQFAQLRSDKPQDPFEFLP